MEQAFREWIPLSLPAREYLPPIAEKERRESPGSVRSGEFVLSHMASHRLLRDVALNFPAMTHASLDQPRRPGHAGPITVVIYILVNLGAILRIFGRCLTIQSSRSQIVTRLESA